MVRAIAAACVALAFANASHAIPVTYADSAAFLAALPGPATTVDFDSLASGTLVPSGGSVDGITFSYDFGGVQMAVTDIGVVGFSHLRRPAPSYEQRGES